MNELWLTAPLPALRAWRDRSGHRHAINPAAQTWGLRIGMDEQAWAALAQQQLANAESAELDLSLGAKSAPAHGRRVVLENGCLLWLMPDQTPLSLKVPHSEQIALMTHHGRMGVLIRNLRTGEGLWDRKVFEIFGLDPEQGTPSFDQAFARIHPDDRAAFMADHVALTQVPGSYSVRFRVVRPDGEVRYVNSLFSVSRDAAGPAHEMTSLLIDETEGVLHDRAQREVGDTMAMAVSLAGVAVWTSDEASGTVEFDDSGLAMVGLAGHANGVPFSTLQANIHPADLAAAQQAQREAIEKRHVVDRVARFQDGQGGWRHLMTRRFAVRDEQDRVVAVKGIMLDVSELVRARDQSLALLDRTQLVADAIGVGFWWRDLDLGSLEWDDRMYRLHGRDKSEGTPSLEEFLQRHVHPDDQAWLRSRQEQHIAAWPPASEVTFRIMAKDGTPRWIQSWTRRLWRDGRRLWRDGRRLSFGLHVDVTERREAELRVKQERERDRFAIEAAGVGVWEHALNGRPGYWSAAMYRLRGLDPADARPIAVLEATGSSTDTLVEADRQRTRCLAGEGDFRHEFQVLWPTGQTRWLQSTGHATRNAAGDVVSLAGVTVDVTERHLAERLARERDRAEQASAAKSELMARVSHELRTPMNAVLGFAELMALDALAPAQIERLGRIRTAGSHLRLGLIDDLLELAKADTTTRPLVMEAVPVARLLRDAAQWVDPLARTAEVSLQLPADLPADMAVMAEGRRLGQVITNLLTNGIKYNRRGGQLWLTVAPAKLQGLPAWRLGVHDNGRGMSADQQARLFEPFNRLGMEREGIPGTGIGLSIVRQLVQEMGGTLGLHSEAGQGSAFEICLPAATSGPVAAEAVAPLVQGLGLNALAAKDPIKVLYVEDNPVNDLLVRQILGTCSDYEVISAPDGQSGITAALSHLPRIVLLDLQLPDMSGLEVFKQLQEHAQMAGVRFVALSANAMPSDIREALSLGFDAYWTKPLDVARFLADMDAMAASLRLA